MPRGHHIARCHHCGREWMVGDCIPSICPECERDGHRGLSIDCPKCRLVMLVTTASQDSPGPQTVEEAKAFHDGYIAGLTRYATAIGHSGLKSENTILRGLMDDQGWKTIETFEKLTGRKL